MYVQWPPGKIRQAYKLLRRPARGIIRSNFSPGACCEDWRGVRGPAQMVGAAKRHMEHTSSCRLAEVTPQRDLARVRAHASALNS